MKGTLKGNFIEQLLIALQTSIFLRIISQIVKRIHAKGVTYQEFFFKSEYGTPPKKCL